MSFMRTESEADGDGTTAGGDPTELQVHIDGEFLCTIPHSSDPKEGQTIEDPRITEARRIRIELIILVWDNMAYQGSLGLIDEDPYRTVAKRLFVSDPDLRDFAINGVSINEYTRTAFEEIAAELGI